MSRPRVAAIGILLAGAAAAAAAAEPAVPFGRPLSCGPSPSGTLLAQTGRGFALSAEDATWITELMARMGYAASIPGAQAARDAALSAAGLLRRGHIVAAKMAHDEANRSVGAYRSAPFSESFEAVLTIVTQPVPHASYPSTVRAEGESRGTQRGKHTHGLDLEESSASLLEIIERAEVAKRAMGEHYSTAVIRYYLLAHAFRDAVALKAASAAVCGLKLDSSVTAKLDTTARFMAMPPAAREGVAK